MALNDMRWASEKFCSGPWLPLHCFASSVCWLRSWATTGVMLSFSACFHASGGSVPLPPVLSSLRVDQLRSYTLLLSPLGREIPGTGRQEGRSG